MNSIMNAAPAGEAAPANETAPGVQPDAAGDRQEKSPDYHPAPWLAGLALARIEGETCAAAYLERMKADTTLPDELAEILCSLSGPQLAGACRAIEKALRRGQHA